MKKLFFFVSAAILVVFFLGCSNPPKKVISFLDSDLGIKRGKQIIMQDLKAFNDYCTDISKDYTADKSDKIISIELSPKLYVIISIQTKGTKITDVLYEFHLPENAAYENEMRDKLDAGIRKLLAASYSDLHNKDNNKDNDIITYIIFNNTASRNDYTSLQFIINCNYDMKIDLLWSKFPKMATLNEQTQGRSFELTDLKGLQTVPKGKIWVLEYFTKYTSLENDSSNLTQGKLLKCDCGREDNRIMYYDIIMNNKCISLKGAMLAEGVGGWISNDDERNSEQREASKIFTKMRIVNGPVLFPDEEICVVSGNPYPASVFIKEYDINSNQNLKEYYEYMSSFNLDVKSFEYANFMIGNGSWSNN